MEPIDINELQEKNQRTEIEALLELTYLIGLMTLVLVHKG